MGVIKFDGDILSKEDWTRLGVKLGYCSQVVTLDFVPKSLSDLVSAKYGYKGRELSKIVVAINKQLVAKGVLNEYREITPTYEGLIGINVSGRPRYYGIEFLDKLKIKIRKVEVKKRNTESLSSLLMDLGYCDSRGRAAHMVSQINQKLKIKGYMTEEKELKGGGLKYGKNKRYKGKIQAVYFRETVQDLLNMLC